MGMMNEDIQGIYRRKSWSWRKKEINDYDNDDDEQCIPVAGGTGST